MSYENETIDSMHAIYADFRGFLEQRNWLNAFGAIDNMNDFSPHEAKKMRTELQEYLDKVCTWDTKAV